MASLWNMLREEIHLTVNEFKEKGAVGALRDAVLDAGDLVKDAGGAVYNGVRTVMTDKSDPVLHFSGGLPQRGALAPLVYPDGSTEQATVLEVDGVSDPPRARVEVGSTAQMLLVDIVDPLVAPAPDAAERSAAAEDGDGSLLQGLRQELQATVQDFREKGAVTALKDAAIDAVDIVKDVGGSAVSATKTLATPLLEGAIGERRGGTDTGSTTADEEEDAPSIMSLEGLKHEFRATVQDFRDKGAVGALKDAALDAVDIGLDTAKMAKDVAGSLISKAPDMSSFDPFAPKATAGAEEDGPLSKPAPSQSSSSSSASPSRPAPASSGESTQSPSASASSTGGATPGDASAAQDAAEASTSKVPPLKIATPADEGGLRKRSSIVSARRSMFEKKKTEDAEELID